jgi:DNA-directed RNA polymerase subunit RPC12/RpoP
MESSKKHFTNTNQKGEYIMIHNNSNEQKEVGADDWQCSECLNKFETDEIPKGCPSCKGKNLFKPDLPQGLLDEIGYEYLIYEDPENHILLLHLLSVFYEAYGLEWLIARVDRIRKQIPILKIKFEVPNRGKHLPPDRGDY